MDEVRVTGTREVPPDPGITDAVGRHHTLPTAIADLVDNSIDAAATRVHVRFLTSEGRVQGLRVIDDGRGMDATAIDAAMTFAGRRDYTAEDLGHFGLGLKAASLSQADILDVYSQAAGSAPVGRRIAAGSATTVGNLDTPAVGAVLASASAAAPGGTSATGTVIEWRNIRTFLSSSVPEERAAWLSATIEDLRTHLGIVLHRILERGMVTVTFDEFDTDLDQAGAPRTVVPVNPFGYTARTIAPLRLTGHVDGGAFDLIAHVWPAAQTSSASYRLFSKPGDTAQGFFVYRNDRLLQAGGWNGVAHGGRDLAFARVLIDLTDATARHSTINPEKSGVEFDADLRDAIAAAVDAAGTGFRDYLVSAESAAVSARRRKRRPVTLAVPRRGLGAAVLDALADTVTPAVQGTIEIRWRTLRTGTVVEVDLDDRTLWINTRYRPILGTDTGEANDAPVVKTLLLLLYSRFFEGAMLGAREREELQAFNELLLAAVDDEEHRRSRTEQRK